MNKHRRWPWITCIVLASLPVVWMMLKMNGAFISDTDYFWHIELGKNIVETQTISTQNNLSWVGEERGLPFINHSWMSDILLYVLSSIRGYMFGAYLYGVLTMFTLSYCVYALWRECLPANQQGRFCPSVADLLVLTITTWALYETRGNPRPQQLSLIFFVIAWWLLKKDKDRKQGNMAARGLIVLATAWANFHGGTLPILFALTGLQLVAEIYPSFVTGNVKHEKKGCARRIAAILVGEILAGCINPYGITLYTQLYRVSSTCAAINVTEWQPANMNNAAWVFVSFAALLAYTLLSLRKIMLTEILPACAFAGMTLLHVRAYPWYAVSLAIFALEHRQEIQETVARLPWAIVKRQSQKLGNVFVALSVGAVVVMGSSLSINILTSSYYREFSDELTKVISSISPERMYTSYNSGGMAIQAGFQSFVDSRADAFTPEILADSTVLSSGNTSNETKINEILSNYEFDALLLAKYDSMTIISYFDQREDWTCVYSDNWYALYVPTTGAAQLAAEYMSLNEKTGADNSAFIPVYIDTDLPVEYVAPQTVLNLMESNSQALVFFTDASNNSCREWIAPLIEWTEEQGYEKLYVCNIEQYRMKYGYDQSGNLVVTQNRKVGYDELIAQLDGILPQYEVESPDGEKMILDAKTIEPPLVLTINKSGDFSAVNIVEDRT